MCGIRDLGAGGRAMFKSVVVIVSSLVLGVVCLKLSLYCLPVFPPGSQEVHRDTKVLGCYAEPYCFREGVVPFTIQTREEAFLKSGQGRAGLGCICSSSTRPVYFLFPRLKRSPPKLFAKAFLSLPGLPLSPFQSRCLLSP